jgi:hypothetical protein
LTIYKKDVTNSGITTRNPSYILLSINFRKNIYDADNDLWEVKVNRWRQKVNKREEWGNRKEGQSSQRTAQPWIK